MNGFEVFPDEMDSMADELDSGTGALDRISPPPLANAGESMGVVARALEQLERACAGVAGGLHGSAEDVREAKAEYLRVDESTIAGMPRPWGN